MSSFRDRFLAIVFIAAALVTLLSSWSVYLSAWRAAKASSDAFNECDQLAVQLEQFRTSPRIASLEVEQPDRIAARVTFAAAEAQLSPLAILSVDPQSPVRIGRTPYQIRATQIVLQNMSLGQVASFASGLEEAEAGTFVRDLVLSRSKSASEDGNELWNVRMTLTQMIFSPISERGSTSAIYFPNFQTFYASKSNHPIDCVHAWSLLFGDRPNFLYFGMCEVARLRM